MPGGGLAVALLQELLAPQYAKRQAAWQAKLYEAFEELADRGVDVEELVERPEFVTAVNDASRIAMGEHLEEKLDMLKAVLVNAGLHDPGEFGDLWTVRYLRWIDELDPAHIVLMRFGLNPKGWFEANGQTAPDYYSAGRRAPLDQAGLFPKDVVDLLLEDLGRLQLGGPGSGMVTQHSVYDPWVTERGRRFLDWLTIV